MDNKVKDTLKINSIIVLRAFEKQVQQMIHDQSDTLVTWSKLVTIIAKCALS